MPPKARGVIKPKTIQLAKSPLFVGMDLHKIILQIVPVKNRGRALCNERIDDNSRAMRKTLSMMPPGSKYVIVIVHVACDIPAHNKLHLDVTLSNSCPYPARMRPPVV